MEFLKSYTAGMTSSSSLPSNFQNDQSNRCTQCLECLLSILVVTTSDVVGVPTPNEINRSINLSSLIATNTLSSNNISSSNSSSTSSITNDRDIDNNNKITTVDGSNGSSGTSNSNNSDFSKQQVFPPPTYHRIDLMVSKYKSE